jgi:hypothetical protein
MEYAALLTAANASVLKLQQHSPNATCHRCIVPSLQQQPQVQHTLHLPHIARPHYQSSTNNTTAGTRTTSILHMLVQDPCGMLYASPLTAVNTSVLRLQQQRPNATCHSCIVPSLHNTSSSSSLKCSTPHNSCTLLKQPHRRSSTNNTTAGTHTFSPFFTCWCSIHVVWSMQPLSPQQTHRS